MKVYPNPFKPGRGEPVVNFSCLPDNVIINIYIYNLAGELARGMTVMSGSTTWDGRNDCGCPVASGTYIYMITDTNGNKKTGKVAVIW
ncbi:MAG: T9SS type A sorting domain-containing protein [bacterium]